MPDPAPSPPSCFLDLDPEFSDPSGAAVAILPVPYDLTSSWHRGSAEGPGAIIAASAHVEHLDLETGSEPHRRGIATLAPVDFSGSPEDLADVVAARVQEILRRGQLPVVLGGEHSVTIGAVRAALAHHGELTVLQLDAHADTRQAYLGSACNHACVMARVREWCPIVQVGIRSLDVSELADLDRQRVFYAHEIAGQGDRSWMDRVVELTGEQVYVTIDVDVFDPGVLPATGTPEPGGLGWYEVTELLRRVTAQRRVVGFDVVELLPGPGQHASAFTAAKLVHRVLAMIFANG